MNKFVWDFDVLCRLESFANTVLNSFMHMLYKLGLRTVPRLTPLVTDLGRDACSLVSTTRRHKIE